MSVASIPARQQTQVVGLISFAHLLSHLYMLALPPLFPLIHNELGVDYTELGLAMTAFSVATGALQTPMGFLCQRIGARPVLIGGLLLNGAAIALVAFAHDIWQLGALMFLAGVGSSVFHPADYAILSGTVEKTRVGRAFAIHTFGGTAGFALAPVVMVALSALAGWRVAVLAVGVVGVLVSLVILALSGVIGDSGGRKKDEGRTGWRELIGSRPIVLFFLFYVGMAGANAGIAQFGVAALTERFGVDLALANTALTVYLVATMAGVLPGGWLADKTHAPYLGADRDRGLGGGDGGAGGDWPAVLAGAGDAGGRRLHARRGQFQPRRDGARRGPGGPRGHRVRLRHHRVPRRPGGRAGGLRGADRPRLAGNRVLGLGRLLRAVPRQPVRAGQPAAEPLNPGIPAARAGFGRR